MCFTPVQDVIEAQEKTITSLLLAVKEQHDQLDHQKLKIKNLEEKAGKHLTVNVHSIIPLLNNLALYQ